ncbi:hypothetical protein [Sporisorium scitamineum]|nr:hypothetical protein [Sporisorium scitamineum]
MTDGTAHEKITAKLAAAGSKTVADYLRAAFPHKDISDALAVVSIPASAGVPDEAAPEKEMALLDIVELAGRGTAHVLFYIKVKGKGKGRPVMYDYMKSSVAQVYEYATQMSLPDPLFDHIASGAAHLRSFEVTVQFDGLSATDRAGSIKEAKEGACDTLVQEMLARNRDVYKLKA